MSLWLKYTEMEMKHKQVNHARNLWDKAVTILPRVQQFWYKYTYMEEMLGNVAGARQIFERWMEWHPDEQAWHSYIKMELRYGEVANVREPQAVASSHPCGLTFRLPALAGQPPLRGERVAVTLAARLRLPGEACPAVP